MYQIQRKGSDVQIFGPTGISICTTTQESYVVFKDGDGLQCKQVKELSDRDLILALASAVRIVTDDKRV